MSELDALDLFIKDCVSTGNRGEISSFIDDLIDYGGSLSDFIVIYLEDYMPEGSKDSKTAREGKIREVAKHWLIEHSRDDMRHYCDCRICDMARRILK